MRGQLPVSAIGGSSQHHTSDLFGKFASGVSAVSGHPFAFLAATAIVVIWAVSGPVFGYSDTWQLVINTGTTIITFLMVFLIQHTQNRDTVALQLKLDELIVATKGAHNDFACIEEKTEAELNDKKEQVRGEAASAD
ncbi:low affinity iron permease [Variibacter gotjawalensis]|uniref:Low affinity iron permease n=1 Tax=Variibacter gotjawalensis TaxID=1333996 RepID=A0A0S3PUH3_9BRAD|nr:low affinity iron permease family protein [Variibacter gotjawalensis]NIK49849.1 low affinity Fe/Cu permease [Variibacter gotjawalensis]RZS45848.1 low affinity Fe/Cu permease [Variibacter gotjawalensis]BAT59524.1 low affinity iron permease [Variibacter gotjawalensis]